MVKRRKKDYVLNKYNKKIYKCCASCIHNKGANNEFTRICDAGEGIVPLDSCCAQWQMRQSLDEAGHGDGLVKKKKYLNFVLKRSVEENEKEDQAKKNGMRYTRASVNDIRAEYLKKNESIYING